MKIVNIVPGFGGTFYCGNCLRDSGYTKSLIKLGHEALMLPIYLPLNFSKDANKKETPLFYGAVGIYMRQNFKLFRNMPKWMEKLFNSPAMLRYAAKKAGSTRTDGLEEMTISMLNGAQGKQKEELKELIEFLKYHEKPDVVHLSNALLLGLAGEIKEQLKIPVVCSLQDEDVWVDAMRKPYNEKTWSLMAEKANDIDAFIAVSRYYADQMKQKMKIPESKMNVIYIGIEKEIYQYSEPVFDPPAIGYLSRMFQDNGFELLIDAFIKLKENLLFKEVKLKLTGGFTTDDKAFVNKQIKKLKQNGLLQEVEFIDNFNREALSYFFSKVTFLTVPVLKGEAFGTYQLESLACGTPLVQPALGAFPEIIEVTGGGTFYTPNTLDALVAKWTEVLSDPEKIKEMSKKGREAVMERYTTEVLTNEVLRVYENVVRKNNS